jgi:hypothetical protein
MNIKSRPDGQNGVYSNSFRLNCGIANDSKGSDRSAHKKSLAGGRLARIAFFHL